MERSCPGPEPGGRSRRFRPLPTGWGGRFWAYAELPPSASLQRRARSHRPGCYSTTGRPPLALRLVARPVGGEGQEEILEKRRSGFTARIKERCGIGRRETAGVQTWEEFKEMRAEVIVEKK